MRPNVNDNETAAVPLIANCKLGIANCKFAVPILQFAIPNLQFAIAAITGAAQR
jgi:hypothetical protein